MLDHYSVILGPPLLILELVVVDRDFEFEHKISKEDQVNGLILLFHTFRIVYHDTAPGRVLDHVECLDLLHVSATADSSLPIVLDAKQVAVEILKHQVLLPKLCNVLDCIDFREA